MTYSESVDYLYGRLPIFHRVGAKAIKPGLGNIVKLSEALGNPHTKVPCIHIAGTNGKGSSSHMLAAILQSAGYKTGLYTSPHLKSFTERIRINGIPISEDSVATFVSSHKDLIENVEPSFFEITVAMAFDEFARQEVDIAVIEVGLGGRLDSTNIITPLVSLITNIGWDHADVLGDSLELIAAEKAGIIKPEVPVVVSETDDKVKSVFQRFANNYNAKLWFADSHFKITVIESTPEKKVKVEKEGIEYGEFQLELKGDYQKHNLAGVLKTLECLSDKFTVSIDNITNGLAHVVALTGLKGRWQVLQQSPYVVCDTAHNESGIKAVFSSLGGVSFDKLHIVIGFVKDKDLSRVLSIFPKDAIYYITQPSIPRALSSFDLQQFAADVGINGKTYSDVNEALEMAKASAHPNDCILITGSTYLVAELNNI